ncbi:MAG TPA: glycosyltransferase family 39 protein, partial [Caulobacteraceae bacterium]|nr:glycosyltransferase family 39 protein [Caulobacteraceae bacterium]
MYRLVEQKPERVLRYILYLQLALWTLIPAFTYASAPIDVMENIGWGREWQWGYYKHPPLQAWLTYGAFMLGNGRMWPIYALSQLCVVATQLGVFSLTRDIAGARRGLWAVALFSITYYATLPTPEFNTNVLQMPLWIWAAVALRRAILTGRARWWLALAATVAASLYAKYSVAVLVGGLVAGLVARPDGRASLKSPWPWAAVAVCLAICAPQLRWLWSVDFLPLRFTEIRNHAPNLIDRVHDAGAFVVGQLLDFSAAGLVLLIAGARPSPAEPGKADDRRYMLVLT